MHIFQNWNILCFVPRSPATPDVFNALAGADRRRILDVLVGREKAVGTLVRDLSMSQPQVSKHLRVLSEAGASNAEHRVVVGSIGSTQHTSDRCATGWPSTNVSWQSGWIRWTTTSKSCKQKESDGET